MWIIVVIRSYLARITVEIEQTLFLCPLKNLPNIYFQKQC
jgi:hypothetical protein